MAGRKDRYSPHLGSPRFERSPPLSSNWRNKVIRLAAESKSAIPPCVWEPGLLATLLYSEWNKWSDARKASWEGSTYKPQCSRKANYMLLNLADFVINYWVSAAYPSNQTGTLPTFKSLTLTGGAGKIDCNFQHFAENYGWIWTYHRSYGVFQNPSLSNMYNCGFYDGSLSYTWVDEPIDPGPWKCRIVKISFWGKTDIASMLDTVVVT